ncbi:ABC transporter permease [Mesorhizobium sp. WSM4307]|uniref:ABC transporter permease n=1 Tax=unclassified Mesorhizobium TaxID=325217 RepID=UPI000BB0A457|nr:MULTISPECIES: ABC transporter permease [unclassified Mesorhizobium]PBB24482.1 ABC transporter permease [Mesorhizobium sp. WSM4304]PBB74549.1 ABC transporter permease [Mesorhizobium sp. WSM4308]TRC73285.1 ABC transporter permease [Mesorhizobium sp. WSM4315]TRC83564.1 ABC transporter permease [Mesorhizobium sp. WSM4307]
MDFSFLLGAFLRLLPGVPLTLQLMSISVALGMVIALILALLRLSGLRLLEWAARAYIFVFRSTPLLVQIFLIYYGLSQFPTLRYSMLWPILRQPYWCAIIALALNTAAYGSEIIRGGLQSVPEGQIEAGRACGMSRFTVFRRIVLPLAIRQALPAYGNEIILMVKATALASVITMMEITGLAAKLISETYRAVEVFVVAGSIYLIINYLITRAIQLLEHWLTPHLRSIPAPVVIQREDAV